MKAILTVGVSASGKTTWVEEFVSKNKGWVNINRDDIRFDHFCNGERNWDKYKWKNEKRVSEIVNTDIETFASMKTNIIISDTNLNLKYRNILIDKLEGLGYDVELKDFPITLEEAWKRDARRANGVGHAVIYKQWQQWLEYTGSKKYVQDDQKLDAVIVDVDGTVAKMVDRGPFDWKKVSNDSMIEEVMDIVEGLRQQGYHVVFLSGRDGCCFNDTYDWLNDATCFGFDLFMRPEGDCRKDSIVKEELFWEHVAPKYNVKMVIDDRPQVCRMWRDLGLKVIQVADPYIEF